MTSMKRGEACEPLLNVFSLLKQIDGIVVHNACHNRMGNQYPFWISVFSIMHEGAAGPGPDVEVFVGDGVPAWEQSARRFPHGRRIFPFCMCVYFLEFL